MSATTLLRQKKRLQFCHNRERGALPHPDQWEVQQNNVYDSGGASLLLLAAKRQFDPAGMQRTRSSPLAGYKINNSGKLGQP